jgi:hypothetical protein
MTELDENEVFEAEDRNHAWLRSRLEILLNEDLVGPKRSLRKPEPKRHVQRLKKCRYSAIDGCRRYEKSADSGICSLHYQRERKAAQG